MSISFNDISPTERVPLTYIEFDNTRAVSGTPGLEYKVLIMGFGLDDFQGQKYVPYELKRISSAAEAKATYGPGSQLAIMLQAAIEANPNMEYWAMPILNYADSSEGKGMISVYLNDDGVIKENGTCEFYLGDDLIRVPVYDGDEDSDIARRIGDAMFDMIDLPVYPSNVTSSSDHAELRLALKWEDSSISSLLNASGGQITANGQVLIRVDSNLMEDPQLDDDSLGPSLEGMSFNIIVTPWINPLTLAPLQDIARSKWGPTGGQPPIIVGAGDYSLAY